MLLRIYQAINFRLIKLFSVTQLPVFKGEKTIYLTFDDGPDPQITPIVLNLLDQYKAKATFFNIGKNNELYPNLLKDIIDRGHSVGNHTYSHLNGLTTNTQEYINDIEQCNNTFESHLLRPAYGASSLREFFILKRKYKIILWNKGSNDHNNDMTDYQKEIERMIKETRSGNIILFHNKEEHKKQTLAILPEYLKFLSANNYIMKSIQ